MILHVKFNETMLTKQNNSNTFATQSAPAAPFAQPRSARLSFWFAFSLISAKVTNISASHAGQAQLFSSACCCCGI